MTEYKAHKFSKYQAGIGEQSIELWWKLIAANERNHGNPVFKHWHKWSVDGWTDKQREWLAGYWGTMVSMSEDALRSWKVAKAAGRGADVLRKIEAGIFIKEVKQYDKKLKTELPTGVWRSFYVQSKSVTKGVVPRSGFTGGRKYNETERANLPVIRVCPKEDLIEKLADHWNVEESTAKAWFAVNRQKNKQLLHHHGGGCWSTFHPECMKPSEAELLKAIDRAKAIRSSAKNAEGPTPFQKLWLDLFADMPNLTPDYESPAACPLWQWIAHQRTTGAVAADPG